MTEGVILVTTSTIASTTFSAREVPWMKLGKLIDEPVTAAEAIKLAGLDFTVSARPIAFLDTAGKWVAFENKNAIVNDETGHPLGIMSDGYQMLQYSEAFDFMDAISPHYVAGGSLKGGRQGFLVVKAPTNAGSGLKKIDPHDFFIVLRTSHDGTRAVEASVMSLRRKCMNQLTLKTFAKDARYRWSVKHTKTMAAKLAEAQSAIMKLDAYSKAYAELVDRMSHMKVTEDRAVETLKFVLPNRPKRDEQIQRITHAWMYDTDHVGFGGTGWGLVNAVSEYFDWGRTGGTPESRFLGAIEGQTHAAINKTMTYLLTT
jgi:phage/plasmid-like protein (TIGR03299 family)